MLTLLVSVAGLAFLCDSLFGIIGILPDWPFFAPNISVAANVCGQWQVQPNPKLPFLKELGDASALTVVSPNNAWIVGSTQDFADNTEPYLMALHWNGYRWTNVPVPNLPRGDRFYSHVNLNEIEAIDANDIWAVGSGQSSGKIVIRHWNGSEWNISPSPVLTSANNHLYGLAAVAKNDVWAVGHADIPEISWTSWSVMHTSIADEASTLVMHWDGIGWKLGSAPDIGGLNAVAAVSAEDIWAVGNGILHWDGKSWMVVPSPDGILHELTVIDKNNIWAVGEASKQPIIMHWDGADWKEVASPEPPHNVNFLTFYGNVLNSVVALAPDDVWAVGTQSGSISDSQYQYRNKMYTVVEHWDGKTWEIVPSPNTSNMQTFFDIVAVSKNELWVLGEEGDSGSILIDKFTRSHCPQ